MQWELELILRPRKDAFADGRFQVVEVDQVVGANRKNSLSSITALDTKTNSLVRCGSEALHIIAGRDDPVLYVEDLSKYFKVLINKAIFSILYGREVSENYYRYFMAKTGYGSMLYSKYRSKLYILKHYELEFMKLIFRNLTVSELREVVRDLIRVEEDAVKSLSSELI